MKHSRLHGNSARILPARRAAACLLMAVALLVPGPGEGAGSKKPAAPIDPFASVPEFSVSGRYAEACTNAPLCGAWFGSPPCGDSCRKIMLFQFIRSRYGGVELNNLTAVIAVESSEAAITRSSSGTWQRCDLILPDAADSAQADAMRDVLALILRGRPESPFTSVRVLPLAVGISETRILVESAGELKVRIRPLPTPSGNNPAEIINTSGPFPCLGGPYVYGADTLFYAVPAGPEDGDARTGPWIASGTSAALTLFSWNREVAVSRAPVKPE